MNYKIAKSLFGFLIAIFLVSCSSTRIVWIPVYSTTGGGEGTSESYDPEKSLIINPSAQSVYAYFKTENQNGIVFSNPYTIQFSNKVTYTISNGEMAIDKNKSTGTAISHLVLSKSFFYTDPTGKDDTTGLFYYNGTDMVIFNDSKFNDGQIINYAILGESVGTSSIDQVTLVDVLPPGLVYQSSEYYFQHQNGKLEHKLVTNDGKNALVFDATLNTPLGPGQHFVINVSCKVSKKNMGRIF